VAVLGYVLSWSAAVNAKWKSGASTDLTGLHYGVAAVLVPIVAPVVSPNGRGWFQTALGEALILNLSGAVPIGGEVVYELIG
jgi:hypothetical protein